MARLTYHLMPAETWASTPPDAPLTSPSLDAEGFIHCTDGATEMVATANRHYREDPRAFVILGLDLDRVGSPWRIDDPGRIYPHVHGPIARASIVSIAPAPRAADGTFLAFAVDPAG